MAFPDDVRTLRDITTRTGKRVQIVIASLTDINNAIDLYYRASKEIQLNLEQLRSDKEKKEDSDLENDAETPIAQSLYLILRQAVRDRASVGTHPNRKTGRIQLPHRRLAA